MKQTSALVKFGAIAFTLLFSLGLISTVESKTADSHPQLKTAAQLKQAEQAKINDENARLSAFQAALLDDRYDTALGALVN